jgi:hypothetical protein
MSKMIQIRNVPDELHRTLKVRVAKAGMTLSDYLLSEIEQVAEKPTMNEWLERVARTSGLNEWRSSSPSKWTSRWRSPTAGCGTPAIRAMWSKAS